MPTPEEAELELASGLSPAVFETGEWPRYTIGTSAGVRSQLDQITVSFEQMRLMIVTIVHDHQARLRSYELLAEIYQLDDVASGRSPASPA